MRLIVSCARSASGKFRWCVGVPRRRCSRGDASSLPLCGLAGHACVCPSGPPPGPRHINQPVTSDGEMMQGGVSLLSGECLDAWSRHVSRLAGRYWCAGPVRLLWRGHGPGYSAAACGLGDPRGEPSGDGNRRVSRARDGDRQGRHRRAGGGLHRGAKFHRRAEGQDRRSPVPARAGHLQGGGRAAARQSRQGKGDGGQHRAPIAARPGARPQSEHPAIHARPARGRRRRGASRGNAGAGAARPGANQSRLYRDPLAHRWTDRTCHLHRRQPGQSLVRDPGDDRQPGSRST